MTRVYHVRHTSLMSNTLTDKIKKALSPVEGLSVLVTIGNDMRSDDGVGPFIFEKVSCPEGNPIIMNAAQWPENIVDKVIELSPEKVVFIDAANFGGSPGDLLLVDEEDIPETTLSTHMIPVKVIARLISSEINTRVMYLGIQIRSIELGEGLSPQVKSSALQIIGHIKDTHIPLQ